MIFYGSIKQKWLLKALHNGYQFWRSSKLDPGAE
ncbi:hypothetical protein Q426_10485 [Streptococcus equi subsp. zooepidemicus CY]|nr:hypothetical protein Q426_10485 [Streptococcus equi subsp. zooepidemicus CY]